MIEGLESSFSPFELLNFLNFPTQMIVHSKLPEI